MPGKNSIGVGFVQQLPSICTWFKKARIFIRTQLSDFKRSQCLQKAAVLVLLGVFWTQTSALDTFVLQDPDDDYVTGTMTVHNEHQIAEVHVRSGLYSSDSIFDYSHGYVATRLLSRRACFIMKINRKYIPNLQDMGRLAFERKTMKKMYSPNNVWVQFRPGHSMLGTTNNWLLYGKPIEQLCRGLPVYELAEAQPLPNADHCANAGVPSILNLKICEQDD
ncbi:gastrokine-2 [Ciconia boyciana]|uniref:gastrokine-2 n=1 Tax=Ciconia boyciana TaxID=52775 RepID=UPI003BA19B8B